MDLPKLYSQAVALACDPAQTRWIAPLLWLADVALTAVVVCKVPYTEIDFSTYMQQVRLFLMGVRDYTRIEGDTGPCVYPAGHLYVYSGVYYLTEHGKSILSAQVLFAAVYLATLALVMGVYVNCKAPPYLFPLLILSKRLHSIFVLRLFNDCFATLLLYLAILACQRRRWSIGSMAFSFGVSVKMSILLGLPGLILVLGQATPVKDAVMEIACVVLIQAALGAPFLYENWQGYLSRAFELSREFLFRWTVNWRFVGEDLFLSRNFHLILAACHLALLAFFGLTRWTKPANLPIASLARRIFKPLSESAERRISARITPTFVATTILSSVAVGMLFARSLHYQFYANIAWASPLLLWRAGAHPVLIYALWAVQEWSWNVFPSTDTSSGVVVAMLALQVIGVWWGTRNEVSTQEDRAVKARSEYSR